MAGKDKPYRVYKGGRAKGPIRHEPLGERAVRRDGGKADYRGPKPARSRRPRWRRRVVLLLGLVLLLAVVWGVLGYLAFRSGVKQANARLDPRAARALAPQGGLLMSTPANILLLGADVGGARAQGPARSDAIVILRTDPGEGRMAMLSIPRDLRVEVPGYGTDKINAAYSIGGPTLALKTVESVTGLRMNHIVVVDFSTFGQVVDALGGITVSVPNRIVSNRFDCPFGTKARCDRWPGWRFRAGEQELDGQRALIYARIRENRLDPSENDFTRGERQQQVIQAIVDDTVGFRTYLRGPLIGDELVRPLATDLSAAQLVQLAWVKFRTPEGGQLRCRLGGTIADIGGSSYVVGSEENASVIAMITGETAPQPPPPGSGPFGPGCRVGRPASG